MPAGPPRLASSDPKTAACAKPTPSAVASEQAAPSACAAAASGQSLSQSRRIKGLAGDQQKANNPYPQVTAPVSKASKERKANPNPTDLRRLSRLTCSLRCRRTAPHAPVVPVRWSSGSGRGAGPPPTRKRPQTAWPARVVGYHAGSGRAMRPREVKKRQQPRPLERVQRTRTATPLTPTHHPAHPTFVKAHYQQQACPSHP